MVSRVGETSTLSVSLKVFPDDERDMAVEEERIRE